MTADVVSVLGFFISIYTLIQVRSVKASLIARLRLPQLIKSLTSHASTLSTLYKEHDTNLETVELVMTRCSADLENLIPKLAGASKSASIILLEKISDWREMRAQKTKTETWQIYTRIIQLIATLNNEQADQKWEPPQ